MLEPITKWSARVTRASVVPEAVRKSFKVAQAEKPGACHLELPQDVANEQTTGKPLPRGAFNLPEPDEVALSKAADLINASVHPIILAGNGVIRSRASDALRTFATKLRIPVAETFMTKGVMPADSDLSLFTIGLQVRDYVACGFDRADLVIAVGYDFVEYSPSNWNPNNDKRILHIDQTMAETDDSYIPDIEVLGNISSTLISLSERAKPKAGNSVTALRELVMSEMKLNADNPAFPVKPQRLIHDLREVLNEHDVVVCDVGAHKLWLARMFPTSTPGSVIISNGLSSMGFALPGALAAKLVYPKRNVVAVCGDGGFMMNCQELETAKRLGLNVVVVIFRDNGYGSIRWKQLERFGHSAGVDFGNPDFVAFARSFGVEGYRVEKAADIIPVMENALDSSGPAVVDIPVDYGENLELTKHLGNLVCPE
jgi:acetolactate synthase-1/2/3 large subunit